jgi:hypothetical protein
MCKKLGDGETIIAPATTGSYFVLSGVYFLLVAVNVWLGTTRGWGNGVGQVTLLLLAIGFAWIVWLQGFKIAVQASTLKLLSEVPETHSRREDGQRRAALLLRHGVKLLNCGYSNRIGYSARLTRTVPQSLDHPDE